MIETKSKRTPAGAAVPGGANRPKRYPNTLVILISDEMQNALAVTADENGVKKAVIARDWLEAGRAGGGQFVDETDD